MHTVQIVVSHTSTIIAKLIRLVTKGYYNHCSVVLDRDFSSLFSFSRKYKYFWFTGCFTRESLNTIKCNDKLNAKVYEIAITDTEYEEIVKYLRYLLQRHRAYNYIGAVTILFNKNFHSDTIQLCSTFTAYVLSMIQSIKLDKKFYLYTPMDIYTLLDNSPNAQVINVRQY